MRLTQNCSVVQEPQQWMCPEDLGLDAGSDVLCLGCLTYKTVVLRE